MRLQIHALVMTSIWAMLACDGGASSSSADAAPNGDAITDSDAKARTDTDVETGGDPGTDSGAGTDMDANTSGDGETDVSCDVTYDSNQSECRLDPDCGWEGESDDGCPTDQFTTWPEWECDLGDLSGSIVRFWSNDTIPTNDPDYDFAGHDTIVNASDETLEMGIMMLSVDPVVISKVDFLVEYPSELLEFTHIEPHWAAAKRDEPPSEPIDVKVIEPGLLQFTWSMECLPRVVHKGDILVASMYFDILASGEGVFDYPRPDRETWDNYDAPHKWTLKSEVADPRAVWATMVDGTEGPVHWLWNSSIVIR